MPDPRRKIDPPEPRVDLVRQAARSSFKDDFEWINDKEMLRVTGNPANRGYSAIEIRELAREWIANDNPIECVPETRTDYRDRRNNHYDVIISPLSEFPHGLFVYMELHFQEDDEEPVVRLLNAHPPTFY